MSFKVIDYLLDKGSSIGLPYHAYMYILYLFSISAIFHFGFYGRILVQIVLVPGPMTAYPLLPSRFGMTRR